MARINLLPWREELRKQQQQEFLTAIISAATVTAAILLFVHMHINGLIDNQKSRNEFLQTEINLLDKKIKEINKLDQQKNRLIAKMNVIQRLQSSRPEIVHLFDELSRTIPDGVYIKTFTQSGANLTVNGVAQSNARVSAYMREIDASPWLANPNLQVIQTKAKSERSRESSFTLKVKQAKDKPKKKANKRAKKT